MLNENTWIDIALYMSSFSVFLIIMFIIIYSLKMKALNNKLNIYDNLFDSLMQDITIMKKAIKQSNNSSANNVDMMAIDKRIKDISKDESNQSLVPILEFVKEFSSSFKTFQENINSKIENINNIQHQLSDGISSSQFNDNSLQQNTPRKKRNINNMNLSQNDMIVQLHEEGLNQNEIQEKTGIDISEVNYILQLNGFVQ